MAGIEKEKEFLLKSGQSPPKRALLSPCGKRKHAEKWQKPDKRSKKQNIVKESVTENLGRFPPLIFLKQPVILRSVN